MIFLTLIFSSDNLNKSKISQVKNELKFKINFQIYKEFNKKSDIYNNSKKLENFSQAEKL